MIVLTYFFRNQVRDANRGIRTAIARINGFLQEHISGMAIVQLFNRERKARKQFAELNRIHMEAYKDAIDAFSFFFPAVEFLSMSGIALLFWVGWCACHRRHHCGWCSHLIHDVRAEFLPADSGSQRKIQYPAGGHGGFRASV